MFENMSKSLILQHCERSEIRCHFYAFLNLFCPSKIISDLWNWSENSNETFLANFTHCVPQKYSILSDFLKDLLRMGWALEVCPLFNLVSCVTLQKMHDINWEINHFCSFAFCLFLGLKKGVHLMKKFFFRLCFLSHFPTFKLL